MKVKIAVVALLGTAAVAAWGLTVLRARDADRVAPNVTLVAPATGAVVRGDVRLVARAHDGDTGVAQVDFFVDGEWVAAATAAPWTARWEATVDHPGERLVQAKATDEAGNTSYSAEADITIADEEPPAVWIMEVDGSSVRVGATDNVAIDRVELFVGTALVAVDDEHPFVFDVAESELDGGPLKAKAIDTSGNVRYSEVY